MITEDQTWFSKWRIKINVDKTQAIVFTRRRLRDIPHIKMNNRQIEYAEKTKYLGIILDKKTDLLRPHKTNQSQNSK